MTLRFFLPLFLGACAGMPQSSPPSPEPATEEAPPAPIVSDTQAIRAPELDSEPEPEFASECAVADLGLRRAALRVASAVMNGSPSRDASDVEQWLREERVAYVWPHSWTLTGRGPIRSAARSRLHDWLASFDDGGERRCGIAVIEQNEGTSVVAAIAVDAAADLAPLPSNVRVGAWVELNARISIPSSGAKVVVLGPSGPPKPVPTSFRAGLVRARFAADRPGPWLLQVLGEVSGGPRQVLEALIMAGSSEAPALFNRPAPGERELGELEDPRSALFEMVNAARASEGAPALARDSRLDELANEQAGALLRARRIAHDVGSGDPQARIEAAGLVVTALGENVAHAESVPRVHRALWGSPSHRANILNPRFGSIGIGVARDEDGSAWVCELFARFGGGHLLQ